jgi:hypothetical protein
MAGELGELKRRFNSASGLAMTALGIWRSCRKSHTHTHKWCALVIEPKGWGGGGNGTLMKIQAAMKLGPIAYTIHAMFRRWIRLPCLYPSALLATILFSLFSSDRKQRRRLEAQTARKVLLLPEAAAA